MNSNRQNGRPRFTATELLIWLVSFGLASWLALLTLRHFEGAWRWVVFAFVLVVVHVVVLISLHIALFCLIPWNRHRSGTEKRPK